jgi:hypothetical protein
MNSTMKAALVAIGTVLISDMVVKQFTDAGDSATEQLLWRAGSAAAVGIALAKVLKG